MCPGSGLIKTSAARTCKEIKINFKDSKNGIYWLNGRNQEFKSAPFQAFCWNTDRDGGGWTLFLRSWYRANTGDFKNRAQDDAGDVNDDQMQKLGSYYKLDDKKIRAVIGQKDHNNGNKNAKTGMFSYMTDQSDRHTGYSDENNEYGIMKKYTARWRFYIWDQMESSTTAEEYTSYLMPKFDGRTPTGDGVVNWKGRPKCGKRWVGNAGAGISCRNTHNGKPRTNPAAGRGCTKNKSRNRSGTGFHLYMLNTNYDTYNCVCNGFQHSSHNRFAARWYIRTADSDKVA